MDIEYKALWFFLQEFNLTSNLTLADRLRIQYIIYLLQLFDLDLDLGYRFVWRQYGPYSFSLTEDVDFLFNTDIKEVKMEEIPWQTNLQVINERINKVKNFLTCKYDLNELAWLRILASVHYLMFIDYETKISKSNRNIINIIKERELWIDIKIIEYVIEYIQKELISIENSIY